MAAMIYQVSENLICEGNCNYLHISCFFQSTHEELLMKVKDCSLFTLIVSKQQ